MFDHNQVRLDPTTREAVEALLRARGDRRFLNAIVDEALKAWLQQAACADPATTQAAARGYLWKSLFLPEGTLLRCRYRGDTYVAQVEGDDIVYQGAV